MVSALSDKRQLGLDRARARFGIDVESGVRRNCDIDAARRGLEPDVAGERSGQRGADRSAGSPPNNAAVDVDELQSAAARLDIRVAAEILDRN